MLRSMTGFGAGTSVGEGLTVNVELRSVNHRYLQSKLRLPNDCGALETVLEAKVKDRLARGAVNGTVSVERTEAGAGLDFDVELAKALKERLDSLAAELGIDQGPSLAQILALPGVTTNTSRSVDLETVRPLIETAFSAALDSLISMREREGQSLLADLKANTDQLRTLRERVLERSPESVAEHQKGLKERIAALLGPERPVEEKDLTRELALLSDRLDVAEETSRLGGHLEQFEELVSEGGAVGRKLDFVVQECLREVNTIGSKCNDAEIARLVVEAKNCVERLREQVQNVE